MTSLIIHDLVKRYPQLWNALCLLGIAGMLPLARFYVLLRNYLKYLKKLFVTSNVYEAYNKNGLCI